MPRLDACLFLACVFFSCCYVTSSNSLRSFLQRKRNSHTAAPHENTGTGKEEEDVPEYEYPQYTPDAFPPCVSLERLTELKEKFTNKIDENKDSKATFDELRLHLQEYNPNVRDETVDAFLARRDMNGDGVIDFVPEYVKNIIVPDYSKENALEWFSMDDTNGDGFVSRKELMGIAQHMGASEDQAKEQVSSYYLRHDKNGDDKLNWDEYKVIYGQVDEPKEE